MKLSESRKKANKNWDNNNKERVNYLKSRSTAKNFINKKSNQEDLNELRKLINKREAEINTNNQYK